MGMVIHDDFWEACQAMPEKQRAPFLYALVEYRFNKKEPKGSPPWLPTFIVLKQRIDMGDEASERGRKMAQARWGKRKAQADAEQDTQAPAQYDAQAYTQAYADAYTQANAQAYTQASNNSDAEVEVEVELGESPYIPPMPGSVEDAPFSLRCLAVLNDLMGTAYTTMPSRCRHMLDRSSGTFTVEQVRSMIAFKRKEWAGTKYRNGLTPNTLFSPDHFEQYMHQALAEQDVEDHYAAYN